MTTVTRDTKLCAILADPIHHVTVPQSLNRLFEERCMNAVLVPIQFHARHLHLAASGLRVIRSLDGFVVTEQHDSAIVELSNELTPAASRAGVVNVVMCEPDWQLHGDFLGVSRFVAGLIGEANQ